MGQMFPADYIEVRYEELVCQPEKTLAVLGRFLEHDLDYRRIQRNAIGRIRSPNTVWNEEPGVQNFNPVNRWKSKLSPLEITSLEALIGDGLEEFAYPLTTKHHSSNGGLDSTLALMRIFYPKYFEAKLLLQSKTAIGRLGNGTRLELTDPAEIRARSAQTKTDPIQNNPGEG